MRREGDKWVMEKAGKQDNGTWEAVVAIFANDEARTPLETGNGLGRTREQAIAAARSDLKPVT